ncbi:MAG: hypothetical protein JSS02_33465 [Planctomycetes bacterium]|nr:hypothetical protein [Planctomycetota bacterium]
MSDEINDDDPDVEDVVSYPPEVETLHAALGRLIAVTSVVTGLKNLAHFEPSTYSLPGEFGDLPHALLRRTDGGLADEMWAHTEFELSPDEAGWLTLEFLAWWVRDLSRSGRQIQLRPMALPPRAQEVQLGHTLKFIIDHLVVCPGDGIEAMLAELQERGESLSSNIDDYADVLGQLARPA